MDKQANPLSWRPCCYCGDRFYGRREVCVTCRAALQDGEVTVYRSEDPEEDGGPSVTKLTREEVLAMPRGKGRVAVADGDAAKPVRRLKKAQAQESGIMVQVNETMSGTGLDYILKAVSGFVGAAPAADYDVAITVKKAG